MKFSTLSYGYLTWEWTKGIRSYIHPVFIAAIYKTLEAFNLDQVQYLVIAPRIFQAILTAFADYRFYKWTGQSKWALFMVVSSWFWFYTGSRTLANTVETALTSIALSYFPWQSGKRTIVLLFSKIFLLTFLLLYVKNLPVFCGTLHWCASYDQPQL